MWALIFGEVSVIVRKMDEQDVEAVNATCIASFLPPVADTFSVEGKTTFSNIAANNAFLDRMKATT